MATALSSAKRQATRTFRAALHGLEGPLLAHPNARFQQAPANLAHSVSGAQINAQDGVEIWREAAGQEHRAVPHPGIVTISGAGLIGHTERNGAEHRSVQAIVNIADSSGRPLLFPFKKHWNLKSSLKHFDLLFAGPGESAQRKVALLGSSHVSFYHFMTEVAGDWWFLKQMGYGERDFSAVVVHGHRTRWQEEILQMLGIPVEKRRYHFEMKERHIDLVLPYRTKGDAVSLPSWMCEVLRGELGRETGVRAGVRKLYLSRKNALRRRMTNEAELTTRLKTLGFEVWQLDEVSVAQQQELLGSARVVVAEHGAALTNIVWCPKDATVIDIHAAFPANPCFKILADQRGLRYIPISAFQRRNAEHDDWNIDTNTIETVLSAVRGL